MRLPKSWTRRAQARAAAREDGEHAAGYGLSRDVCRFAERTEKWRAWNAGWRDGMREHSEGEER
jgi:ribosome modulation factor